MNDVLLTPGLIIDGRNLGIEPKYLIGALDKRTGKNLRRISPGTGWASRSRRPSHSPVRKSREASPLFLVGYMVESWIGYSHSQSQLGSCGLYISGYQWMPMDIYSTIWISMDIPGCPSISMDIHGNPLESIGCPRISMDVHGYPWIFSGRNMPEWQVMLSWPSWLKRARSIVLISSWPQRLRSSNESEPIMSIACLA